MTAAPTVSVVIPCHNDGRFLRDALDSLQAQTFRDFETIVVDDGSTDADSLQALRDVEHECTRVIRSAQHGVVQARNTAIAAARGRYILPLDADDRIGSRYLELAVPVLEHDPKVGIVYCKAEFFGEKSGAWELPPYRFPEILIGNVIFNCALFRREDWQRVGGFNPNMHEGWEDFDFWVSLIELGRDVRQLPDTLFYYRIKPASRNAAMLEDSSRFARAYARIYRNHPALYHQHIDVVFAEMVRLWGVIADRNRQLQEAEAKIASLTTTGQLQEAAPMLKPPVPAAAEQQEQPQSTPAGPGTERPPLLARLWRALRHPTD